MRIKVNGNVYEVSEKELTVKENKLYNTKTKQFEGVEGDLISITYEKDGKECGLSGSVGGYTYGNHVIIRPNYEFVDIKEKHIEHIMPVMLVDKNNEEDEAEELMTEE